MRPRSRTRCDRGSRGRSNAARCTGGIYPPLRWTAREALQMLNDVPRLEAAGIVVRVPGNWRTGRPPRPVAQAPIGTKPPSLLGAAALLDFNVELTLDGERLTAAEMRRLLSGTEGLQLIRGRWVEIDRDKLARTIERFEVIEKTAASDGLSFAEAMRLMAGADIEEERAAEGAGRDWSRVVAGPWLAQTLQGLRSPEGLARVDPGSALQATLRPYQQAGGAGPACWSHPRRCCQTGRPRLSATRRD
jgi:non-specific serine/threonine protein kinase